MNLTASDVCEIIKACALSGVTTFSYETDNETVTFSLQPREEAIPPVPAAQRTETVESNINAINLETLTETEGAQLDLKDAVEELMISDPSRYEEFVARGELIDEKTHDRGFE